MWGCFEDEHWASEWLTPKKTPDVPLGACYGEISMQVTNQAYRSRTVHLQKNKGGQQIPRAAIN